MPTNNRNEPDATTKVYNQVTANLERSIRYAELEGRMHIICPMVMITEGVHAGSQGPLYYSSNTLQRNPSVWNGKPLVVYHPEMDGVGISACSPEVFNASKIGTIFNTTWDGKLRCEAWIDVTRCEEVDPRIMEAIRKGQIMEVSTGLYTQLNGTPGVWNGEEFDASIHGHGKMCQKLTKMIADKGADLNRMVEFRWEGGKLSMVPQTLDQWANPPNRKPMHLRKSSGEQDGQMVGREDRKGVRQDST